MPKRCRGSRLVPLTLLGGIGLGYTGVRALLGLTPGADDDFFAWDGPTETGVDVGSALVDVPANYYREDSFAGFFSAALGPVRAALPSAQLHPVTLPGGRALVAVFAFNYLETDLGPYGEVGIVVPCVHGQQAPPLLPLALEARYPGWGCFVLHLPVTSRLARDAGRVVFGLPKFVSDMAFEKRPSHQQVRLSEGDRHILTLTVRQQGLPLRDNRPLVIYSVRDGQLLRTTVPSRAVYQVGLRPRLGTLVLGDHPIADELGRFEIDTSARFTRNYLTRSGILPAGEPVGTASRSHAGHLGEDREYGALTVSYDDRRVEDRYAGPRAGLPQSPTDPHRRDEVGVVAGTRP
jgi:hypothetical protein